MCQKYSEGSAELAKMKKASNEINKGIVCIVCVNVIVSLECLRPLDCCRFSERLPVRGGFCMFSEHASEQLWFFWHRSVTLHGPRPLPPLGCTGRSYWLAEIVPSPPVPSSSKWRGERGRSSSPQCEQRIGRHARTPTLFFPHNVSVVLSTIKSLVWYCHPHYSRGTQPAFPGGHGPFRTFHCRVGLPHRSSPGIYFVVNELC